MTRAQYIASKAEFLEKRIPGSFFVEEPDSDKEQLFYYCCPCGCGACAGLLVGNKFKPQQGPSWRWNGSLDKPELMPSVNHIGHWHGWLRQGSWSLA